MNRCLNVTFLWLLSLAATGQQIFVTAQACDGSSTGTIRVDSTQGLQEPLLYSIDGTSFQSRALFTNVSPGTYTVAAREVQGNQEVSTTVTLTASSTIAFSTQKADQTCDVSASISVNQIQGGNAPYLISIGIQNAALGQSVNVNPGNTRVTVTDAQGCSQEEIISILNACIQPYTALTPNGDGKNDTWEIQRIGSFPDAWVAIYNRYGQKVYESSDPYEPWEGTHNGTELPSALYYYVIQLYGKDEKEEGVQTGTVTLLR